MKKKEKKSYKRRHYFVKKKLQSSFILKFFILPSISLVILNIALYFLINKKIEGTFFTAHIPVKTSGEIILPYLIIVNLLILLAVILILMKLVKSQGKKMSGPLLRFQAESEKMAQGVFTENVDLRKEDMLVEFQDKFNFMMNSLNENLKAVKEIFFRLKKNEKSIEELISDKSINVEKIKEKTAAFFQDLEKIISEIQTLD